MVEWSKYFKDKSLVLNDVHIKVRTNNSLENFNRTIKHSYNIKRNMKLIKYIDTLLKFAKNQIEFFKEKLNALQKKKIISNNNDNDDNLEDNFEEFEKEIEFEISKENLSCSETETNDNRPNNISINSLSNNNLINFKAFLNENNSCLFDSFLILFINGILLIIS